MAVSTFTGAGGAAGGEALPINALEKVYEAYSEDGFFEYSPAGGVPAGNYIIEVEGSGVDYVEAVGKGQASKGKNGRCYLTVEGGGAISATASAFGDTSVAATQARYSAPSYVFSDIHNMSTYSFMPYDCMSVDANGNWVTVYGTNSTARLYTSTNGIAWRDESQYSQYANASDVMTGSNLNDPNRIGDIKHIGSYVYAATTPVNTNGLGLFRSSDPQGRAGTWTHINSNVSAWNIIEAPSTPGRIVGFAWGTTGVWTSDNDGVSQTWRSTPNGLPTWGPAISGTDIYAIESARFYTSGNSYIIKSTNDGDTWSTVNSVGSTFTPLSMANKPGTSEWVIIGRDNSNYSYTGYSSDNMTNISWSSYSTNTTNVLAQKVIWSEVLGGVWAYSTNTGLIATSSDGTTWTNAFNPGGGAAGLFREVQGYLIYGSYSTNYIWVTEDGVTIQENTSNVSNFYGVAFGGGNYLITNGSTNGLKGPTLDSLDKVSWGVGLGSIVGTGNLFLAKNGNSSNYYTSTDGGTTWTAGVSNGMYGSPSLTDGTFFRFDTSYRLWSSTDLVSWTQRASFSYQRQRIKKVGDLYVAYAGPSNNQGYSVSSNLESWTDVYAGSSYSSGWGFTYDESSGWTVLHSGNGAGYGSTNFWAGSPYQSSTYGMQAQVGYTGTGQLFGTTSDLFDGVEAGGVGWVSGGYVYKAKAYDSTYNYDLMRYMYTANSSWMVAPYSTSAYNQPAVGRGKVTSIQYNNSYIYQFSYGKPASIAIYRMKDAA